MSDITDFIARWKASGGSEQANSQLFLAELCAVLDLPPPDPARPVNEENLYSFERKVYVPRGDGTEELKRLDLYRQGCFVLESKQGQGGRLAADSGQLSVVSGQNQNAGVPSAERIAIPGITASSAVKRGTRQWEDAMQRARRQAENYVRCLPAREGRPPFIIVADVGYCFDIYSEFTCTGGLYLHFPDARSCRVMLDDLEKPEVRALFQAIWNDPISLDPSRRAAKVTEEIAAHLAELASLLEAESHSPEKVSQFLMRCIFSMFAEDVGLIPAGSFTDILRKAVVEPDLYEKFVRDLWTAMNDGSVSVALGKKLLCFNGNIFADPEVLPLGRAQIRILLEASGANWQDVEPAIFGTLLERALNPKERHKLGAHYTPRAYVERLVIPTVIQPLRKEWDDVQATASLLFNQGKEKEARNTVGDFQKRLLQIRVLDPACGSGNFLYVVMEHIKRLEGEVLQTLKSYGAKQYELLQITPEQFLGIEINPRAAHIAEMVLWIGYLQWHFRTRGNVDPPEPVIKKNENIRYKDALLGADDMGAQTSRLRIKKHADKMSALPAEWPEADFIVGNPPFIGGKDKRQVLGNDYFDALTKTYAALPESCDFVMYWWHKAAELARAGKVKRFGFITTNSITQVFNRRVVALHTEDKNPLRLIFAIPDHPWVDAADGAAVRIAMTVGERGAGDGALAAVVAERETDGREIAVTMAEKIGVIHAGLRQGTDVTKVVPLASNCDLCCPGMKLHGSGFIVTPEQAIILGLGRIAGLDRHIRPYRNGRDIADNPRGVMVIDLFGLTAEEARDKYPEAYHWVYTRVKPERDKNNRASYREAWWIYGEPRKDFRPALAGLPRYISTIETAKHRFFVFLSAEILPDNMLVNIASSDAYHLGVLSSRIHVCWALAAGGTLEDRPRYNKSRCFDPFPFPDAAPEQQTRIRDLGEKLDAHRKSRQKLYPELTMTGMYNVLEALRSSRELTDKEKNIYEYGLVGILRELHDELDAAVADAYGWPRDISDEEILSRLVALNAERAEEEKDGKIRWLRPEYQTKSKEERKAIQTTFDFVPSEQSAEKSGKTKAAKAKAAAKMAWPSDTLEQLQAVRSVIDSLRDANSGFTQARTPALPVPALPGTPRSHVIAERFTRAPRAKVEEIVHILESLGFV